MEADQTAGRVLPPWNPPDFFTDDALRAAQEYYFQTHATNSRLIAEGRNAVGFMKSNVRRKLEKEIGEDFKMYTGVHLGDSQDTTAESLGIRGELNKILENVYKKISAGKPIESPIQEDRTILTHPLGGLEVCYALVYQYTTLMKRYASLAGNRRKVLKSILDEELFKWIWRLTIGHLLSKAPDKFDFSKAMLSTGFSQIPLDRQRVTSAEKVREIGQFLLGKTLKDSHLRFPLAYYYVTYLRYVQNGLLSKMKGSQSEAVYVIVTAHKQNEPVSDVLVAIDELMNTTGNSGQSYDDILKSEEIEMEKYIPGPEIEFIAQYREFSRSNLGASLKKIMPSGKFSEDEDAGASLMPLLLMLRTLPLTLTKLILEKIPGPYLVMFNSRLARGGDDISADLAIMIKEIMEARTKSGETYSIRATSRSTTRGMRAKSERKVTPSQRIKVDASGNATEEPKPDTNGATDATGDEPREQAGRSEDGASEAAGSEAAAGGEKAPSEPAKSSPLDEPVVIEWRVKNQSLLLEIFTPRDLMAVAGPDVRIIFQLVKFAVQTGQIFRLPPDKISKEVLEGFIAKLIKEAPPGDPVLSKDQRQAMIDSGKTLSPKKLLAELKSKVPGAGSADTGHLKSPTTTLSRKLGGQLDTFLRNPGRTDFRRTLTELSAEEKQAVSILNRVSRLT